MRMRHGQDEGETDNPTDNTVGVCCFFASVAVTVSEPKKQKKWKMLKSDSQQWLCNRFDFDNPSRQ